MCKLRLGGTLIAPVEKLEANALLGGGRAEETEENRGREKGWGVGQRGLRRVFTAAG